MPVIKVPVRRKFGIVSLSRAEELLNQQRAREKERSSFQRLKATEFPEINQAFVEKYNSTAENAREPLDKFILQALQLAKYRAGIVRNYSHTTPRPPTRTGKILTPLLIDVSPYDTSIGWLELTLLCQCYGNLQQEALLALCASLNNSPISIAHIPSLIYMAGLCYQWLKNDVLSRDLLRTGELILVKIVYLISVRLYYHHLLGYLLDFCTSDELRQLKFDLEGFENKEKVYRDFPEALFQWKFSLEVGLIICENYSKSLPTLNTQSSASTSTESSKCIEKQHSSTTSSSSHKGSSLTPMLWHSLDIWKCTKQGSSNLHYAIEDLLSCSTEFNADKWMESVLAMNILCIASQLNPDVLNLVQSLAMGKIILPLPIHELSPKKVTHTTLTSTNPSKQKVKPESEPEPEPELTSDKVLPVIKGTRFILPTKKDFVPSTTEEPLSQIETKDVKITTLNVLGVQPDFDIESSYTAGRTQTSYQTKSIDHTKDKELKASSADDVKLLQCKFPTMQQLMLTRLADYSGSGLKVGSAVASSVGTQDLIDNESIPEPLPSATVSNITVLDMGSVTTIDAGESLAKSIGLFASSTSKNLDILVSPVLGPSGELTSTDEQMTDAEKRGEGHTCSNGLENTSTTNDSKMAGFMETEKTNSEKTDSHDDILSEQSRDSLEIRSLQDDRVPSRCTHYTHSTAPLLEGANMLGSQVHPSTVLRESMLSREASSHSLTNQMTAKELPKFHNWPSEVAFTYAMNMASIVIYGRTSLIQRNALEGVPHKTDGSQEKIGSGSGTGNYGLLDLAGFEMEGDEESSERKTEFPSWSIRYEAILGLSRVSKTCRSLPMKDGLSSVAWSKLMERHAAERDPRVLEAFNISQVEPDLDGLMTSLKNQPFSSPLIAHIANGLSELYLPLELPSFTYSTTKQQNKVKPNKVVFTQTKKLDLKAVKPRVVDKLKLTPKPSFNARTFESLNAIAKEDWKRQMQQEKEHEEMERQKEEEQERIEHEEKLKRKALKLAKRKQTKLANK